MRIGLLGGLRVEHDGRTIPVSGAMQQAVLFRLAVDAGVSVSYRAIAEDIWGLDAPENTKAALQSIVSRLRSQLPADVIESTTGGYRLNVARADVDALEFFDLIAAAEASGAPSELASDALALWSGEPWIPSDNFDWFTRDLGRDHARALELGGLASRARSTSDLPAQLTGIVGREHELELIADQLLANRLVTIIGTGGAGKTRLAVAAASARRNAILVELAPIGPSEILAAVLTSTGREIRTVDGATESGSTTRDRVLDALAGREVLLVLDNCEHVIDSAAEVAQDLLSTLPQLRILATSREPLGVPGEAFVALGSLAHPADSRIAELAPTDLADYAALQLFCQRVASARGVGLDDEELPAAARICARLDGLPLAIELAAAKLRTMTVDEVLTGLDDRFALLTGGYRTALPRHQTLRAMIDWSWSLLDDHERQALLQFAVFPAGVSATDARALATELRLGDASVFDALVDRSLLQRTRGRFRALETVREYGIGRLSEAGGLSDAREVQARFVTRHAEAMDRMLRGPRIMDALAWFDAEEDNLTSALRYATAVPLPELAVRLVLSSSWYWIIRDRNDDAQEWFVRVAPIADGVDTDEAMAIHLMSKLMEGAADLAPQEFGEIPDAVVEFLTPLQEFRVKAGGHDLLQLVEPLVDAFAKALESKQWINAVQIADVDRYHLDPWPKALLHVAQAAMSENRGALAELGIQSETALTLFKQQGDVWGIALSEQMHSIYLAKMGKLEEALALGDSSTEHMRNITTNWDLAQQQGLAIQMLLRLGRTDEAVTRVTRMLDEAHSSGIARTILQAEVSAASVDVYLGDLASAGSRLGAIQELRSAWHGEPGQVVAGIEALQGAIAIKRGDLAAAEAHLRISADAAVRSQDQPIIGTVAIAVGTYALACGDVETAVRAVDFSTSMIGAYDSTNPEVIAIDEAAGKRGIGRPSTDVPERPMTIGDLQSLLAAPPA
ncbi:MAG TPA: AAA family ATPase [Galbitalea sp.]|nr:AAA family ATPase [Galbitalea sp.]